MVMPSPFVLHVLIAIPFHQSTYQSACRIPKVTNGSYPQALSADQKKIGATDRHPLRRPLQDSSSRSQRIPSLSLARFQSYWKTNKIPWKSSGSLLNSNSRILPLVELFLSIGAITLQVP